MSSRVDSSPEQELPRWQERDENEAHVSEESIKKGNCCGRCIKKCGPLGIYFSPMFDRLGYSLSAAFYHLIMFPYTLAVCIFVTTLWSVSIGLLILLFGFILYWFTCEISLVLARIDLAIAYYMVEDDKTLLSSGGNLVRMSLSKDVAPCPCNARTKCCAATWSRMKSVALRCDTYRIFFFQVLFKPLIVFSTCWIFVLVVYNIACVFAPLVYIIDSSVFTKHYWCPLGSTDCDNDGPGCECYAFGVENFGSALLYGFVAFLVLPLVLHINIWFAKASKNMSYLWLTDYYIKGKDEERGNLLAVSVASGASDASGASHVSGKPTKRGTEDEAIAVGVQV